MTTWITDENNNRASIEYWGSEERARESLASLKNCRDCTNCSGCAGCAGCLGCSRCLRCSRCSRCTDCSDCSDCSRCSRCSRCSDCSDCSDCADCSDCCDIAFLYAKEGLQGDPEEVSGTAGAPSVPVIQNIHKTVYEAASQPKALNMKSWHSSCGTTHCRAGWVVALAGEDGRRLEEFHDTQLAAMLIYQASSPGILVSPTRFYEDNEMAMIDMKRLADIEAEQP